MISRAALLSATLFLVTASFARAEKPTLPVGEWGDVSAKGPDCKPPFLKIEQNRIIQRLGGGEGRCAIRSIKEVKGVLFIKSKCVFDKSIPPEHLIEGDGEAGSFSIAVKGPTKIVFNNGDYELCPANSGGQR